MTRNWVKVIRLETTKQSMNIGKVDIATIEFGNTWKRYRTIVFRLQKRIHEAKRIENVDNADRQSND